FGEIAEIAERPRRLAAPFVDIVHQHGGITGGPGFGELPLQRCQPRGRDQVGSLGDRTIRQQGFRGCLGAFFFGEGDAHRIISLARPQAAWTISTSSTSNTRSCPASGWLASTVTVSASSATTVIGSTP